jgi:hypothetical protein
MDLQECLSQLRETGTIGNIQIGKHDMHSTFHIYQKLYGREHEIKLLLNAFEEVTTRRVGTNLLLVSGMNCFVFTLGACPTRRVNSGQRKVSSVRGAVTRPPPQCSANHHMLQGTVVLERLLLSTKCTSP